MSFRYSAGKATAYGAAVAAGYTGTYEEFCAEQAQFAEHAQQVAQDAAQVAADRVVVEADTQHVDEAAETFTETTVPEATAAIQQEGADQVSAVQQEGATQVAAVRTVGGAQVAAVESAGEDQVEAVEAAGSTQTGNVNTAGTTQVGAVNAAGATQVEAVNSAGTTQTGNVNAAGTTQVGNVNTAGAAQVQAVEAEGAEQVQAVEDKGEEYIAEIDTLIEQHIDDTLTQPGMAADAKKTGDEIADLKVALEVLQPAATSADVGKALIAKTVENDKVTEYKYGEAGAPPIKDTASGAIASFPDGADGVPMDGVVVTMEPVQDLHGYDNPWPAGGGKNLVDMNLTVYANATSFTLKQGTYTVSTKTPITANTAWYFSAKKK